MKKIILLLLAFITSHGAIAQYNLPQNKVWAMGKYVGLDFNGPGEPAVIPTEMNDLNNEGCASICDSLGHLLFYTNGYKVWSANGSLMPHSLNPLLAVAPTATQSSVIVPVLESENRKLYYLFNLTFNNGSAHDVLYCRMVDMNMNGGLGDIDTTFTLNNVVLADSLAEKMVAIPGCNNNIWILVHNLYSSAFRAFEITTGGINQVSVNSTVGYPFSLSNFLSGSIKVSPDWSKIAMSALPGLMLYNFDNANGIVSHPRLVAINPFGFYGIAFSPDGNKLYGKPAGTDSVFQYNLNTTPFTKTGLGKTCTNCNSELKLAPDGKIYLRSAFGAPQSGSDYPARINYPDNAGLACGFQDSVTAIHFVNPAHPDASLMMGLPNEVVLPVSEGINNSHVALDTQICRLPPGGMTLQAAPGYNFRIWNTGDTASSILITQNSTYWVRYQTINCVSRTDTFKIRGGLLPLAITFDDNTLRTTNTYISYQWYKGTTLLFGSTAQSCVASGDGWYSVKVTGPDGCTDSAAYQVTGSTAITDLNALKNSIRIYPNPATHMVSVEAPIPVHVSLFNTTGKKLLTQQGQAAIDISKIAGGLYFIYITDKNNTIIKVEKLVIRHPGE